MSLPTLPDLVVERIIHFAVQSEYTPTNQENVDEILQEIKNAGSNKTWMMVLHNYGQVSRQWRSVILKSRKLFDTREKRLMAANAVKSTQGSQLRQMINEGYMERTSYMLLYTHDGLRNDTETLCAIRNAADKCSIEIYDFRALDGDTDRRTRSMTRETAENLACFIEILKKSKKCNEVNIFIGRIYNQKDAEIFFDLLLAMVQIETITWIGIETGYTISHAVKIEGRTSLVPDYINWNFIGRRAFGNTKIDHIEKVSVAMSLVDMNSVKYENDFVYGRSDDLTLSDFVSKVHGKFFDF